MWAIIIIGVIAIVIFSKYNNDKTQLRNNVILKGGLDQVFSPFLTCIEIDFAEYKIVKMTETEIEIFALTKGGKNFVFANKLGFGEKVNYRCDTKRSSFLNADIAVEGNISNQEQSYQMILDELIRKYEIKTSKIKTIQQVDKTSNNVEIVKEYFCHYEDGKLVEDLKITSYYKGGKLIKYEENDSAGMINSTAETEEFFYEKGIIKFSHLENSMFTKKNIYHYNTKSLLVKIETESENKSSGFQTKFTSKLITYNDNDLIIEEKHLSPNGESFYYNSNTYDSSNNKIIEIIKKDYSFIKSDNKFNTENKVVEKVIYENEKSNYPSKTEHFEYDDENFVIHKTLKYSQYSFLTSIYHNSEWQIQKEISFNTENILTRTIDYEYEYGKLVKIKRTNSDGRTNWTKYIYS